MAKCSIYFSLQYFDWPNLKYSQSTFSNLGIHLLYVHHASWAKLNKNLGDAKVPRSVNYWSLGPAPCQSQVIAWMLTNSFQHNLAWYCERKEPSRKKENYRSNPLNQLHNLMDKCTSHEGPVYQYHNDNDNDNDSNAWIWAQIYGLWICNQELMYWWCFMCRTCMGASSQKSCSVLTLLWDGGPPSEQHCWKKNQKCHFRI